MGTYDGTARLTGVSFPDGRSLVLGYDAAGTLDTVTEVGVDPGTTRSWSYEWSGVLLDRIDWPDGTAWVFSYGAGLTTRMTRMRLEPVRLPGQWDDGTWEAAASAAGLFYNVHRWYENGTGRLHEDRSAACNPTWPRYPLHSEPPVLLRGQ